MTVEQAARVALHWFDPRGEGKYPDDPDLDAEGMYRLLARALEGPSPWERIQVLESTMLETAATLDGFQYDADRDLILSKELQQVALDRIPSTTGLSHD